MVRPKKENQSPCAELPKRSCTLKRTVKVNENSQEKPASRGVNEYTPDDSKFELSNKLRRTNASKPR